MLHELKVSYFPRRYFVDSQKEDGSPLCHCILNETWPSTPTSPPKVSVTGVASFGSGGLIDKFDSDPVQAIYTSTIFADRHAYKFGADWLYSPVNYERYDPLVGSYGFSVAAGLPGRTVRQYTQQYGDVRLPGPTTCSPPSSRTPGSWANG